MGWSLATALCLGVSLLAWSTSTMLVSILVAGCGVGLLAHLVGPVTAGRFLGTRAVTGGAGRFLMASLAVGVVIVTVIASAAVSPPITALLVLLAGVSSPWFLGSLLAGGPWPASTGGALSRAGLAPPRGVGESAPVGVRADDEGVETSPTVVGWAGQDLADLSLAQLCRAWRRSFVALSSATTASQLARVARQRQAYLDELDRRCPQAVEKWLSSGARAASGPERFLPDNSLNS